MPNFRIHEEVAYIFTRKHQEYDKKEFYLGVIAPDAPNLEGFAPKEERWMAHQRDKNYNIWKDNIINFYINNKDNYNKYFIFGYLFHVMTDIVFDDEFYLNVRELIMKDNISKEDSHQVMRKDMDYYGSNFKNFSYIKDMLLKIAEYYDILNINKELMEKWTKLNMKDIPITKSKYINNKLIEELEERVEYNIKDYI